MDLPPGDPRHGTAGGYTNHHCHCDDCREANRVKHADYMERHPEQRQKHRLRSHRQRQMKGKNGQG